MLIYLMKAFSIPGENLAKSSVYEAIRKANLTTKYSPGSPIHKPFVLLKKQQEWSQKNMAPPSLTGNRKRYKP